jgi:hypothetical protein
MMDHTEITPIIFQIIEDFNTKILPDNSILDFLQYCLTGYRLNKFQVASILHSGKPLALDQRKYKLPPRSFQFYVYDFQVPLSTIRYNL